MSADSGADRAEVNATEQRRLEGRLRLAGFPHRKALEESASQPTPDRKLIEELASLRFAAERHPLRTWRPNVYQLAHRRLHGSEPPTT